MLTRLCQENRRLSIDCCVTMLCYPGESKFQAVIIIVKIRILKTVLVWLAEPPRQGLKTGALMNYMLP